MHIKPLSSHILRYHWPQALFHLPRKTFQEALIPFNSCFVGTLWQHFELLEALFLFSTVIGPYFLASLCLSCLMVNPALTGSRFKLSKHSQANFVICNFVIHLRKGFNRIWIYLIGIVNKTTTMLIDVTMLIKL